MLSLRISLSSFCAFLSQLQHLLTDFRKQTRVAEACVVAMLTRARGSESLGIPRGVNDTATDLQDRGVSLEKLSRIGGDYFNLITRGV